MFNWDEEKREKVLDRHGIDFAFITDVFDDPYAVYIEDYAHSTEDDIRFNFIGMTARYGLIFAAYIYEDDFGVRFITARRAENWMIKEYEENRKRL